MLIDFPLFSSYSSASGELRSQTPSPHFGQLNVNVPKNERDMYRTNTQHSDSLNQTPMNNRNIMNMELTSARVPSPHDIRGPSPVHAFLENIRGPLPNPGHLLNMKTPFNRCSRSPLNFPLFPLNNQRRWSEAGKLKLKSYFDVSKRVILY